MNVPWAKSQICCESPINDSSSFILANIALLEKVSSLPAYELSENELLILEKTKEFDSILERELRMQLEKEAVRYHLSIDEYLRTPLAYKKFYSKLRKLAQKRKLRRYQDHELLTLWASTLARQQILAPYHEGNVESIKDLVGKINLLHNLLKVRLVKKVPELSHSLTN